MENDDFDPLKDKVQRQSKFERESDYQKQRLQRELSPERDPNITDEQLLELREKEKQLTLENKKTKTHEQENSEEKGDKTPPRVERKRKLDTGNRSLGELENDQINKRVRSDLEEKSSEMVKSINYEIPTENKTATSALNASLVTEVPGVKDLQFFKDQDLKYFGKLIEQPDEANLSQDEIKERRIMKLLLKIKNGTPAVRKTSLRQLTDSARSLGAKAIFNQILPLLLEKSLDDQERHLLVKVIDRVLYKLDDLIRPYTHKILVVISPLLIDEDHVTRNEGREIISNLSKAAGLSHMISTLRPDIDHSDEYVRNTTARALAVVASALGIPSMLPFLKAVCFSKKSWQARHTGTKIIQQIAILVGCGALPHLNGLVSCISRGLRDEQLSVRIMTAQALTALAEASAPYGIESFEPILEPLWNGIRRHRGRGLAAFLRAIGFMIPLMDPEYASYYTKEVMVIVIREFGSADEEMKKTVLQVVQQCAQTDGVEPAFLRKVVLPAFVKHFWVRRMALDRRNNRSVVETSVILSEKVGVSNVVENLLNILKDESEPFRKMALEAIYKVILKHGSADITDRNEERLIDGALVVFQEQLASDHIVMKGFTTIVNSLGERSKPYLGAIVSTILHRIKNKSPDVRQQAADVLGLIAPVIKQCEEEDLLNKLSVILYESLGEVFPEVLGSILGALGSIATAVGISSMQPPVNQLLPTLTPILRNRHDKVQENAIELVGRIADKGPEFVSPKEWMRICSELLEMLKSPKKSIRRAANNTFGYIAKAVGPQEVIVTLLNNLRVQERQLRVCTAVAIGIVAETCSPFTVLPAIMNEYRTPENNVQNGVLKAMTFLFEYIGDLSTDYIYSITPLLEDALTDRDHVHRQTAATVIRHIALGCIGHGSEDAFIHFLNLLMPNIFETSSHVINRILEGIEGIRNAVGPGIVLNYTWNGLFHPARKVRVPFWRVYNAAYVQQLDAMVPYYPVLEEKPYNLDLFDVVL